jgi:hypothetical protein
MRILPSPLSKSRRPVGLLVTLALGAGCAAAGETGEDCPAGQRWNGSACVDDEGGGSDGGRVVRDAGPTDTITPPPDSTTETTTCEPNARYCADLETAAECNAAGTEVTLTPCPDGVACVEGICGTEPVETCTPGDVIRCASGTAQLVCNGAGDGTEERACPAEAPNCEDAVCTDRICEPGEETCDGNNIVLCADDGRSTTLVETCPTGCSGGECVDPCAGDDKSYVGCAFYAVDLDNYQEPCTSSVDCAGGACVDGFCDEGSAASQQFAVTVSNSAASTVEVKVFDGAGTEIVTRNVAAGALESLPLPRLDVNDSVQGMLAYRIESTGPITAHQFNPQENVDVFSNDASLLLPATSLGTEYIVLGWPTVASAGFGLKGFVTIVATREGTTRVTVTSPVATAAGRGGTPAALAPGVPAEFSLMQGEVLSFTTGLTNGADLSGMQITASEPVAVFAGSECANVPLDNQFCDHIEEQLFPVDTWDRDFVLARFKPRGREPDVVRIIAAQDGTTVRINPAIRGIDGTVLDRGEFVEFEITANHIVGATAPIAVAQYMVGSSYPGRDNGCDRGLFGDTSRCAIAIDRRCENGTAVGDPASLTLVPVTQYRSDYLLLTPAEYVDDYVTIVAPLGADVRIDGLPVGGDRASVGTWDVIQTRVTDGVHRIEADVPIGVSAYGYDCDVSYAYPGGLDLESLR